MLKKLRYFERGATDGYFAHQEYALIAMLGNDNENVARQKQVAEESANNDDCPTH